MCPSSIVLGFALLLLVSFSESQENFTNSNEQNDNLTMQYDVLVSSMNYQNEGTGLTRNSHENFIKNNDEMQYESCINSTKNDCKNDSVRYESREYMIKNEENNRSMESYTNSTEINDFMLQDINENLTKTEGKNDSITFKLYENSNIDYNYRTATIVSYEKCDNITCIQLCCPFGNNLTIQGDCVDGEGDHALPNVYTFENDTENEKLDELYLTVRDPCILQEFGRRLLNANSYLFLLNGSLYQGDGELISPTSYCLAILIRNIYDVIVCTNQSRLPVYISVCLLVSLPFLLLTFIVYSILPELRNVHGYTLRAHVASLFITYAIMYFGQQTSGLAAASYCVPLEQGELKN